MNSDIITTDRIASYTLLAGDFLLVTETGILRNNPITISIAGSGVDVTNDGTVFSLAEAVFVQASGAAIDNTGRITGSYGISVTSSGGGRIDNAGTISGSEAGIATRSFVSIANTGRIIGGTDGIYVENASGPVMNAGTVSGGTSGITLWGFVGGFVLTNLGTVAGSGQGLGYSVFGTASGNVSIVNAGTILSTGSGFNDATVKLHPGFHTIVNTGLISAAAGRPALDLDLATVSLTNDGTIVGGVFLGDGDDMVRNGGTILGQVGMGEGDDLYDGAAGTAPASVAGGAGQDTLIGGAGADVLDGGAGADLLDGGAGRDTASYATAAAGVLVDLADETLNQGDARGDLYLEIEAVEGSSHNDTLLGATGNDTLDGSAGNDVIDGRGGNDLMRGGAGNDLYTVGSVKDRVVERAGRGNDTVEALASYVLSPGAEVEVLRARAANGTTAMNLTGSDTDNTVTGNAGANLLRGLGGFDLLQGLAGDDTLSGGTALNQLTGGAGLDVFLFDTTPVSFVDASTITDFSPLDDTIQLSRAIFPALPLGTLAAGALADGFANVVAETRIIYASPTMAGRQLWYDPDGSGPAAAVQFATLVANPSITAADIVVVA